MKIDLLNKIKNFFLNQQSNDTLEKLEEILLEADVPANTVVKLLNILNKERLKNYDDFILKLKNEFYEILKTDRSDIFFKSGELNIILITGINGVGKTTTCAKLARFFLDKNKKILLVAADTFRAAAIEQLEKLADMIKVDLIKGKTGADPASVVFDAIIKAKKEKLDFVIIDTAGRLHTKFNLMQELMKIKRVILKEISENNLFTFLVLDSNTGKNIINQAKEFNEKLKVSGIILTKFDSISRAGWILSIRDELNIPIKYVTYGEKIEDFAEFSPDIFIDKFFMQN